MFEVLEHTADIGLRATGATLKEVFAEAALGLESIAVQMANAKGREPREIVVAGEDYESVLVNFLNEVLFLLDGARVVLTDFVVEELIPTHVRARCLAERRSPERHPPNVVVKGVTWHQLKIEETPHGWLAEVYLDI
jgi:SHS2 domain-containing protein